MDHDIVVDRDLNIYVVFGSKHPFGSVFSYIKYRACPGCGGTSFWYFRGVPLVRVVERYSVGDVLRASSVQDRVYDPVYGAEVPYLRYSRIYMHLAPEARAREILDRPADDLEALASEAIMDLKSSSGVPLSSIGVGGSILGGFHNVGFSDIDLVVYGCDNASRVYGSIESFAEPLRGGDLERWVRNQASLHGVSVDLARMMYAPYRRSLYRGRALTVVFPEDPSRYGDRYIRSLGSCCMARLEVPPSQCGALQYPGLAWVEGSVIPSRGCRFAGVEVGCVIIYEGAFSPLIYRGGSMILRGLLVGLYPDGVYCLVVGARECLSLGV